MWNKKTKVTMNKKGDIVAYRMFSYASTFTFIESNGKWLRNRGNDRPKICRWQVTDGDVGVGGLDHRVWTCKWGGGFSWEEDNSGTVDGDKVCSREIPTGRYGTGKVTNSRVDSSKVPWSENKGVDSSKVTFTLTHNSVVENDYSNDILSVFESNQGKHIL